MDATQLSEHWSLELEQHVLVVPTGWAHSPYEYALHIDGTFVVAYRNLSEIESYLDRYFILQPTATNQPVGGRDE